MEEFKDNKKFQNIVHTAKELFWKYGIKRVSVEEICSATPVSKMTFYKFFKNKEVLAEYLLSKVLMDWHNQYRTIMRSNIPFTDKIHQVISLEQTASKEMGEEIINDIHNNEFAGLQKLLESSMKKYHTEIVTDMIEAQRIGEIRKDIKPEFILYLLDDISHKVMDKRLSAIYNSKQDLIMELTNYFFYGIMNK